MMKYVPRARAGDIAGCLNGHDLYRVLADILPGQVIESSCFEPIGEQPKPERSKTVEHCHICNMPWLIQGPGGGWVFCNVRTPVSG